MERLVEISSDPGLAGDGFVVHEEVQRSHRRWQRAQDDALDGVGNRAGVLQAFLAHQPDAAGMGGSDGHGHDRDEREDEIGPEPVIDRGKSELHGDRGGSEAQSRAHSTGRSGKSGDSRQKPVEALVVRSGHVQGSTGRQHEERGPRRGDRRLPHCCCSLLVRRHAVSRIPARGRAGENPQPAQGASSWRCPLDPYAGKPHAGRRLIFSGGDRAGPRARRTRSCRLPARI